MRSRRPVVLVGTATAFSLLGDQALYSVLPTYYAELGLLPIQVGILLADAEVPVPVRAAIDGLLRVKAETSELGAGPRIANLDSWIEEQIAATEAFCQAAPAREAVIAEVDAFHRAQIGF